MSHEKIIILDFGGQYAHLIASRIRRSGVLSQIYNPDEIDLDFLRDSSVKGLILSGGPQSVFDASSPRVDPAVFQLGKPILGICYGHQFLCQSLGGRVEPGRTKEYGRAQLQMEGVCPLFRGVEQNSVFWMSHGDEVVGLPSGFLVAGRTGDCANAAVWHPEKNFYGIQFHPEVTHSEFGEVVLKNFLEIAAVSYDWTIEKFFEEHEHALHQKIGDRSVVLFVSGGVDSTVAFAFLSKILGPNRVQGVFFDTGLLRLGEVDYVEKSLRAIGAELTTLRAADTFFHNLEGVTDPEAKREIIGNTFLQVQREFFATHQISDDVLLAQGTIYPDTIETGGTKNAAKIKTHHNRVPEIQKLIDEGKVIEPLAELYKDEVRALGTLMGLPQDLVWRHPFPGPGLGVRILCGEASGEDSLPLHHSEGLDFQVLPLKSVGVQGDFRTYRHPAVLWGIDLDIPQLENQSTRLINAETSINRVLFCLGVNASKTLRPSQFFERVVLCPGQITPDRVARLQRADDIVTKALEKMELYSAVWQFPVVLVPVAFDGAGTESIILRPINSVDAMSASVGRLPDEFFQTVTREILRDTDISAVFLDITSKPPGTIEWE
jgi:GMP synthase (glutamine-hydrolysing)